MTTTIPHGTGSQTSGPPATADRTVRPSDPHLAIADGIRDHYLAQSRAADQVRRVIAASTRPMDEDDGA